MPDDDLAQLLDAVGGDDPSPEFVESLRAELERELSPPVRAHRPESQEVEDVVIRHGEENRRPRRRLVWSVGVAAIVVIAIGLTGLMRRGEPGSDPAVATSTTFGSPDPIDVVREFSLRASSGDLAGAEELTEEFATLSSGPANFSRRTAIEFIGAYRTEVQGVECIELEAGRVSCLVDVVDDWLRTTGDEHQIRWTATVEGGVVVRVHELAFSGQRTADAFFFRYLVERRREETSVCAEADCLAELVRSYAADYAESEFYVEPTPLTLPEPGPG